jgi:branched-chain amino acid transport system permease protein
MDYLLSILNYVAIYGVFALGLTFFSGELGLLSLGHVGFFGIGAYASAIMSLRLGLPFPLTACLGVVVAALVGFLIGLPVLRLLKGDYFVLVTLGFAEILRTLARDWSSFTGGAYGLSGIRHANLFGLQLTTQWSRLLLHAGLLSAIFLVVRGLARSSFGRALNCIRLDEIAYVSLGRNAFAAKLSALSVSAAIAGLSGVLYAHYTSVISPSSLSVDATVLVLCMVLVGGLGSVWGAVTGAAIVTVVPEVLARALGTVAANQVFFVNQMLFGFALILIIRFRRDRAGRSVRLAAVSSS